MDRHAAEIRLLGSLPVNIPPGQPIVIHKETSFEINRKIDAVLFIGNISMPYGYLHMVYGGCG